MGLFAGCADANEIWYGIERPELHWSIAIHDMTKLALDMAGWTIGDIDLFDLYSCFPSACSRSPVVRWGLPKTTRVPLP